MNTLDDIANINKYSEYYSTVSDIVKNETVLKMKNFRQHYDTNTYDHCFHVSYMNYVICKKLNFDYVSCARAGMLHDLFLYDWRHSSKDIGGFHAFKHPEISFNNSSKIFKLNEKEKDIILKHMWPLTITKFPKYKETFIITITDKIAALYEAFSYYRKKITKK